MKSVEPSSLSASDRRSRVAEIVIEQGFARVSDLSKQFAVSEVTLRADLDALALGGRIQRVHGGAVPGVQLGERPFSVAARVDSKAKNAIAQAAADLVTSGESVMIDVGTTTTAVARALLHRSDLKDVTVFTNALNIALEMEAGADRFTVVVTGGTLRDLQHSLVDPFASSAIAQFHPTTAFIGCNGIHRDAGVTNINAPEADVKRAMVRAAKRAVVVADSHKLGTIALAKVCDVSQVDLLITDSAAAPDIVAGLEEMGTSVHIARRAT